MKEKSIHQRPQVVDQIIFFFSKKQTNCFPFLPDDIFHILISFLQKKGKFIARWIFCDTAKTDFKSSVQKGLNQVAGLL